MKSGQGLQLQPGNISAAETVICPGVSQTYSIIAVTGASSYQWTLPSGWTGSSTSNSITATAGTTGGTISVKAINDCGTGEAETIDITVKAGTPNVPGNITGETSVCPGISQTYSIAVVNNATEYIWSLPSGWSGSSSTNSIDVTTGASGSGNISVQAKNDCGTSAVKTLAVSVKPGTPDQPGAISGTAEVCPGIQQSYSVTAVPGATSYEWTLPNSGWTGTSTTNSITVTSGSSGGDITVKALNDCGTSQEQTLTITVKPGTPATPSAISGANTVCPGTSEVYSITPLDGATEYIWTLPSGWSGNSTSETITVTTGQSGSGNITVKAKNDCGTSTAASISVSVNKPAPVMSGIITGTAEVCSTATGLQYSIPAITNATDYIWSLPNGWNITGGSNTNKITVSASSNSGNISVVAKNTCGESSPSANFAVTSVTGVPATPGPINTSLPSTAICPPLNNQTFSVAPVNGASGYVWTLPTGWEITSGANTSSITVNITAAQSYVSPTTVKVKATNVCGESATSTSQEIFLDNYIIANIGPDLTVCKIVNSIPQLSLSGTMNFGNSNLTPNFSTTGSGTFQNIPNKKKGDFTVNYTPTQADYNLGQVKITMTIPQITSGNSTSCGTGTDEMIIFFKPLPTATITSTGPICSGGTSTLTFTGTANSRVTYKLPNNTNKTVDIGASGTATVTTAALTATSTYSLVSSVNLDIPECSNTISGSTTITVTPKPTATLTYSGTPFCTSLTTGQPPSLIGTNAYTGGSYSSTTGLTLDATTGAITPSSSTPGTYTVTYSTKEAGGCAPVTATTQITITPAPTAAISYAGTPFCTSDTTAKAVTLTGTNAFSGGTFSAPAGLTINSGTGAITASTSIAGNYTVTYNTPAGGGCSSVPATTEVTITKAPTVTISYPDAPFCLADTAKKAVTIDGTDAYTGGSYSAPVGLSINTSNGEIDPAASTVGTYTITYKTPASAGCGEVTATTEVSITETPAAEISYTGPFCNNDGTPKTVTFSNTAGAYQGGTFSASPSGLSIDPNSGAISAQTSSPGEYNIVYILPEGAGCASSEVSTTVTITESPFVDISYTTPLCDSDSTVYGVNFSNGDGAYQNGTFTGTNGLSIDTNGNINASNSTPGIHTVTYTTPAGAGCESFQTSTDVEIFQQVTITTQPVNAGICSTQSAFFEVVATGDNLTYQWKRTDGAPITNATGVNSSKLDFSNATATNAGEYFVEVSGTLPCQMAVSEPVTLNIDENIIIVKPTEDLEFCHQDRADVTFEFIAHAKGAPLTFTWIKDGADIPGTNTSRFTFATSEPQGENGEYTGTFKISDPNPSDNGVYAVRIEGPDYFTCSDAVSKTFTLNVNPLPDPPGTSDLVYCQNAVSSLLTATGENGATFTWYDSEMTPIDGVPTPPTSEAGTITYYVTQTTEVCESKTSTLTVTVKPTPAAPTTNQNVTYCFEENVTNPLAATKSNPNSDLNWYGPDDKNISLDNAPTPVTTTTGTFKYWVSETFEGCESPLVEIIVKVNPLPEVKVSADKNVICEGSSAVLTATGGTSYEWFNGENSMGVGAQITVSPTTETTFTVIGTNENNCTNSATIVVGVDPPTVAGTLTGPASVCTTSRTGTLNLSGITGQVQYWEKSTDGGASWTTIEVTSESYTFNSLDGSTSFRAVVKSGVCDAVASNQVDVTIDPLPVGGELNFTGVGRVFMICEGADPGYAVDLNLTGIIGEITAWQYRTSSETSWNTISGHTGLTLTGDQIEALNISETTVFQVVINSGECSQNAYSKTAILSVIPTDIAPSPVTVDPGVVCFGSSVTLNSETGYTTGSTISEDGAFDNASITQHGWRVRRNGSTTDIGFDTDANNTQPDRWKRATPHPFTTANLNPNYSTSDKEWGSGIEDGNKGFAIVSSNNSATMETPVFSIGAMDQAVLTFDQAYNLTPGASIMVEISTDGGNTYNTVLYSQAPTQPNQGITSGHIADFGLGTKDTRPENKIEVDLGNYLGRSNLRIRFSYIGTRLGDVWAIDNIKIPDGPQGVVMEWNDYSDPDNPIFIGSNNSEQYTPTLIGWNNFEVKTKLVFDSEGNACEVAQNSQTIKVFVFDKYTTTVTATYGSCGNYKADLSASVTGVKSGVITDYPTPDGYMGRWVITGNSNFVLTDSDPNDDLQAVNNPNAVITADNLDIFNVSWELYPTEVDLNNDLITNPGCPPVLEPTEVIFKGCTTLDFDGIDDHVIIEDAYANVQTIEAWVRPEAAGGTIISGPNFNITTPGDVTPNSRWYHIAVTGGRLYIDGIDKGALSLVSGGSKTLIGAEWVNGTATNFFSGWIEEVRLWKKELTVEQIRFMMNQRLIPNGTQMGEQIPMDVPDGLTYDDLAGYYRLISADPEPLDVSPVVYLPEDMPVNGNTPDRANNKAPGRLVNMETNQENTAPLPYYSANPGPWETDATWLRPDVWDPPHTGPIEWNIVRTRNDITSGEKDIKVLGLRVESKELKIADPTDAQNWQNSGQSLEITHYLRLDGSIILVGESQLLQPLGSILEEASAGFLERDQQGTQSSFNYNYWSSPVSTQGTANNADYSIGSVLLNPKGTIDYINNPFAADATGKNPNNVIISSYWLWAFKPGAAGEYAEWDYLAETGTLKAVEGFTMKGTSGAAAIADRQNYTFKGKPHNGRITGQAIGTEQNYLVGNPYPSAIDSWEFMLDNLAGVSDPDGKPSTGGSSIFNGSLYFWDHFAGATHYLEQYIGGYATLNFSGGIEAVSTDWRINANNAKSTKRPGRFIPVSQGFFLNTAGIGTTGSAVSGGTVVFDNNQRIFERETNASRSLFLSQEKKGPKTSSLSSKQQEDTRQKIWIKYRSPKGYHRQLLVTADASATDGFDLGYDAPLIEDNIEDMYWYFNKYEFVIQAVKDFSLERELDLGFKVEEAGSLTISIDELMNIPDNMNIYVKDSLPASYA